MLQDAIRNEPPQVASASDKHALETDARAPSTLEQLAHELARRIGEDDVEGEKQAPDDLRHRIGSARPLGLTRVVRLKEQRRDDTKDDRQNTADEDREEVVHAGATTAEAINTLQLIGKRCQGGDKG